MTNQSQHNQQASSEWHYFFAALQFYTRIPVPASTPYSTDILNQSRKYFPLIGVIIGSIAAITYLLSHCFFSPALSVALSMLASILATGAFHEDGFADSCDGLGGGWSAEQVLSIMKDSRVGTYATIALLAILGIKYLALMELTPLSNWIFVLCLIAAHTLSRLLSSLTIEQHKYVQDIDQSKVKPITDSRLSQQALRTSYLITMAPLLLLAYFAFWPSVLATVGALIVARTFANYSQHRIGGYTGDILGAIQQLAELSFYLIFIAVLLS